MATRALLVAIEVTCCKGRVGVYNDSEEEEKNGEGQVEAVVVS